MGARTKLSQCDYILSNDIILKSPWCDYVPKHSYEQQGRFRYVCENANALITPTILIDSTWQSGSNYCLRVTTNAIGNFINFKFPNGYETEIQVTALTTDLCIPFRKIGDNGVVQVQAFDDIGSSSNIATKNYEKIDVKIPALFYPLTEKVYARIVSTVGATVKVYVNGQLRETYVSSGSGSYMFYSTKKDLIEGNLTAVATMDGVEVTAIREYKKDWKDISLGIAKSPIITYTKAQSTIKIPLVNSIDRSFFDGVDIGFDKIGVK